MDPLTVKPSWQPGQSILAPFGGARPPAAQWVKDAFDVEPERSSIDVGGVSIELLTWGEVGKPGLLFLHGAGAQADWWSVIAPAFARDYRVAAISWSGMGRSDWRKQYAISHWAEEALAAVQAAELEKTGRPTVIAHSLGGSALLMLGAKHSEHIQAGILVDSFVPRFGEGRKPPNPQKLPRYQSIQDALARYRFVPEQGTDYPEIVDFIARQSLRLVEADDNGPKGWTWAFDPRTLGSLDVSGIADLVPKVAIPIGLIMGENSRLLRHTPMEEMRSALPECPIAVAVPEAQHHVMVDQPLALITALRATLQTLTGS